MFAALLPVPVASAALLVNETYDAYTPQVFPTTGMGALDTGVTTSAQGLTGNYFINNPGGGSGFAISAGSLAFGSYNGTTGNKFQYRSNGGGSTLAAKISASTVAAGSTLYSSFLVQTVASPMSTASFTETRIASAIGDSGGNSRFRSQIDTSNPVADGGPGVAYTGAIAGTGSTTALDTGTIYMVISRFTNIGQTVSSTATLYVLTLAQYNSFATALYSESYLDDVNAISNGNLTNRVSQTVTPGTAQTFATDNFSQIGGIGTSSGVVNIDALKYGTDLLSVVTIPEPGSVLLTGLGLLAVTGKRRR